MDDENYQRAILLAHAVDALNARLSQQEIQFLELTENCRTLFEFIINTLEAHTNDAS